MVNPIMRECIEIEEKAVKIALLISSVDTDFRGILFQQIGEYLRRQTQHYTASLFERIDNMYREGV